MPLTWPCHFEGLSQSEGPRHPPVPPKRHLSARASWLPAVPSPSWARCGCATWTWGPKSGRALAPHGEASAQLPTARIVASPTTT